MLHDDDGIVESVVVGTGGKEENYPDYLSIYNEKNIQILPRELGYYEMTLDDKQLTNGRVISYTDKDFFDTIENHKVIKLTEYTKIDQGTQTSDNNGEVAKKKYTE